MCIGDTSGVDAASRTILEGTSGLFENGILLTSNEPSHDTRTNSGDFDTSEITGGRGARTTTIVWFGVALSGVRSHAERNRRIQRHTPGSIAGKLASKQSMAQIFILEANVEPMGIYEQVLGEYACM